MKQSQVILSEKLKKQLKSLERNPKYVTFSEMLDEVFKRINKNAPKR